jgi:hypothetical protein
LQQWQFPHQRSDIPRTGTGLSEKGSSASGQS